MLRVSSVAAAYGPVPALFDVSLEVPERSTVALLGANGAGKSTTLKVIAGMLRATSGSVLWEGSHLSSEPAHIRYRRGIVLVPESRGLFPDLTVRENLMVSAIGRRMSARDFQCRCDRIYGYFPRLRERERQQVGSMSGREQQMVAIARGLLGRPRLLMLDEPSLGLAPIIVQEIYVNLRGVQEEDGVSLLLVEQNLPLALSLAQYAYVLATGRVAIHGPTDELRANPAVATSYLG